MLCFHVILKDPLLPGGTFSCPLQVAVIPFSLPASSFLLIWCDPFSSQVLDLVFAGAGVSLHTHTETRDPGCTLSSREKTNFLPYLKNWLLLTLPASILKFGAALPQSFCGNSFTSESELPHSLLNILLEVPAWHQHTQDSELCILMNPLVYCYSLPHLKFFNSKLFSKILFSSPTFTSHNIKTTDTSVLTAPSFHPSLRQTGRGYFYLVSLEHCLKQTALSHH